MRVIIRDSYSDGSIWAAHYIADRIREKAARTDEPFVLTTVDTIFREKEFATYAKTFELLAQTGEVDGLMGVTDYIDDEKPLYVGTNDALQITGFFDTCEQPKYISGGIYGLTPIAIKTLHTCMEKPSMGRRWRSDES